MTDLLLASRAHKTKTNYNFYIKNRILHWGRHIRSIYGFLWPENVNFYPTCSMRKKESMVQLQLHTLPFQLFCPLSYSAKINRQTFTFRKYYNLPILKNLGSKIVNSFKNNWKEWTYVELLFILYIIYFDIVKRVSIDQYCVLQKINFWLSNLIWILRNCG